MIRITAIGKVFLLFTCCGSMTAVGQKAPELDYFILFGDAFDQSQEKFIHEALTAQDPDIQIWIDPPTHSALARTRVQLDEADLANDMAIGGMVVVQLSLITPDHPTLRSDHDPVVDGLPEFIDTGNPDLDDANYQAAKAAWIAAHPEHHEQLAAPPAPE